MTIYYHISKNSRGGILEGVLLKVLQLLFVKLAWYGSGIGNRVLAEAVDYSFAHIMCTSVLVLRLRFSVSRIAY